MWFQNEVPNKVDKNEQKSGSKSSKSTSTTTSSTNTTTTIGTDTSKDLFKLQTPPVGLPNGDIVIRYVAGPGKMSDMLSAVWLSLHFFITNNLINILLFIELNKLTSTSNLYLTLCS